MKELVKKIVEKTISYEKDGILLDSINSNSFDIKKENFSDIKKIVTKKKVAFVDGGNLEIIKAPSFSLFFNRVYYTIYKENKRMKNDMFEFFTFITAEGKDNKILFKCDSRFTKNTLPVKEFIFDSCDPLLIKGGRRAELSSVGDAVRRIAELTCAKEIGSDFIVLDGTLEAIYPYEKEIVDSITKPLFGLSKTTSLLTVKGNTAIAALKNATNKEAWTYYLGKGNYNADVYFLKLHRKSEYALRFEAKDNIFSEEVISLLAENSRDPVFLGYPYALVEADRFARVSKKEREGLQLQIMTLLGKHGEKIKPYLNAVNAHDILDNIG